MGAIMSGRNELWLFFMVVNMAGLVAVYLLLEAKIERLAMIKNDQVTLHPIIPPLKTENKSETIKHEHELAACVLPVYLYADATLVRLFLNVWFKLGASKVLIYVVSMTKDVEKVLAEFQNASNSIKIEIIPWPKIRNEFTNETRSDEHDPDPDSNVYRFAHFLAMNDCALRLSYVAKYVALVDFDEFILPRNLPSLGAGSLLTTLDKLFADEKVGNALFSNTPAYYDILSRYNGTAHCDKKNATAPFDPNANQWTWLNNLQINKSESDENSLNTVANKFVFRPERVEVVHNHRVPKFLPRVNGTRYTELPLSGTVKYAIMYHMRISNYINKKRSRDLELEHFPDIAEVLNLGAITDQCSGLMYDKSDKKIDRYRLFMVD